MLLLDVCCWPLCVFNATASRGTRFSAEQVAELVFEEGSDNYLDDLIAMHEFLGEDEDQPDNSTTSNVEKENSDDDCLEVVAPGREKEPSSSSTNSPQAKCTRRTERIISGHIQEQLLPQPKRSNFFLSCPYSL